ncbi:hypothetical protein BU23DRAFT_573706 [Bimuria novae-zelandiae CBS 107.79]|uniref:Uncharacterized protein n=1 Tax=Bimuria novae-zelandiae CBS 107.79 TaxID=1447943 RepID=A0A6A5UT11_9PLEO|nr:hypothetical protein BU23DRAFT_573706 [Bimuria novae-zelandiae CBS 107.79]
MIRSSLQSVNKSRLYFGVLKRFRLGACIDRRDDCRPELMQYQKDSVAGVRKWFVKCVNHVYANRHIETHEFFTVPSKVDVDYLFNMFQNRTPEFASPICNVVEPRNARIKKCGIEHPTGQGSMKQHKTCSVTFDVVIPANLEHNPYAVLIMFGTHNHIPPPPHVTRMQQLQDIKNVLHPILTPQLTRAQFLNSTQLAAFLHLKGYQSIEDFSITFANKNRLDRIITKEKLIMFPYGTGVGGVMYQQRQKDQFPESVNLIKSR